MRFACVGDNCVDRYLPPIDARYAGGNAVNVAVQLLRLGHEVSYFGAIGNDVDGAFMRQRLSDQGLDIAAMQVRQELPTAYTDIATDAAGDRHFVFEEFGATRGYRPAAKDVIKLKSMDHVHIGWLDDGGALKRELVAAGVSVSQDLSVNASPADLGPDSLRFAFASAGRSEGEATARNLLARGAHCVVITMGADGSLAMLAEDRAMLAAEDFEPVDTTGAGDSFIAGFLSSAMAGHGLLQSLRLGRELASATCLHWGGFPQ